MTVGEELNKLTNYAKIYRKNAEKSIKLNLHMNNINKEDIIEQKVIDAVLTDYINFVGLKHGCDYGLYTIDLQK